MSLVGPQTEIDRARQVLRYFLRNPMAADSLEGVARWRLLEEIIHSCVEETNGALSWLVSKGYLIEFVGEGMDPMYCLNQARRNAAERFVAGLGGSEHDA